MVFQLRSIKSISKVLIGVLLLAGVSASRAELDIEPRLSTTSQGRDIQRGGIGDGLISHDEYEALVTSGNRKTNPRTQSPNPEFWFYDVDVELFSDFDNDGYYYGIDLWFDADTVYSAADVYAVIYLSYEYGPWNEYAVTEDFTLFGTAASDDYVMETELIAGYETGSYDILIELFDAYDGTFLADIGPDSSSELSLLPLEDAGRDSVGETRIVVNTEGGGSPGWPLLLALIVGCVLTRRRRVCSVA